VTNFDFLFVIKYCCQFTSVVVEFFMTNFIFVLCYKYCFQLSSVFAKKVWKDSCLCV